MDSIERKYYDEFEHGLLRDMLRLCTSAGMLDGNLLQSEDIDGKWDEIAPEYLADVLRQMNEYPEVSFGWAGYIGMAVAEWWDQDWEKNSRNGYTVLYGKRGFDDMDDHIVEDVLGYTRGSLRIPGDKGFGRNNVFMRTYGYGQDPSRTGGIAD